MATDELSKKLAHRTQINEGDASVTRIAHTNVYTEFKEFSRKDIQNLQKRFKTYDVDKDNFLNLMDLKLMMEKIGFPQTHIGLKEMIHEVDEDLDGMISFREFMLIFRKAKAGELNVDKNSGLFELYMRMSEIDVDVEGVKGAKNFFQAKIESQTQANKFEEEILKEQEERRIQQEEARLRRKEFKEKANLFNKD